MRRYLSISKHAPSTASAGGSLPNDDKSSTVGDDATISEPTLPLPSPILAYKRLDHYYSHWTRSWKYKNMGAKVLPQPKTLVNFGQLKKSKGKASGFDDPWKQYAFVAVRSLPQDDDSVHEITYTIHIKSAYLLQACKDVIQFLPGVSWNEDDLHVDPYLLLACLPDFMKYRDALKSKSPKLLTEEESYILASVNVLISYLQTDYASTLSTLAYLTERGEITHELLPAILPPRTILLSRCLRTGQPQALQLISVTKTTHAWGDIFTLHCVYIDRVDQPEAQSETKGYERIHRTFNVGIFRGTVRIDSLEAYPIQYHPRAEEMKARLIARGKKWVGLEAIHHKYYKGTASFTEGAKLEQYAINSRVVIDRGNFKRFHPAYVFPTVKPTTGDSTSMSNQKPLGAPFTDENLMLMSPVVQGFSLDDKMWLEFGVENISDIQWDDTSFENLVLPKDRKTLLRSLVEAHNAELGVDDFVRGKGRGLVINLFGPPGTGKTLSAEATSEHVRKPLYVVGLGDLGIDTTTLERKLTQVFEVATAWKAIVLIDEADVFLQRRSMESLRRNAMVAVFLRQLEYYRGILFLTTNRIKAYDDAFLSRIHIALRFQPLSVVAKRRVWAAFLVKAMSESLVDAGASSIVVAKESTDAAISPLTDAELDVLSKKTINGREIKNAVRTAQSLALSRGEVLGYAHLLEVLDVMEQFGEEFEALKKDEEN